MIEFIIEKMHDGQLMAMLLAAIAAGATVFTLVMPLLATDAARQANEVGRRRARADSPARARPAGAHREGLAAAKRRSRSCRRWSRTSTSPNGWPQESAREKLVMAGYRGQAPYVTFLFFRLIMPIVALVGTAIYVFLISKSDSQHHPQDRLLRRRNLSRHAGADAVPEEPDQEAATVDQARVSGCARPAADLRRIRHVGRGRRSARSRPKSARNRCRSPRSSR